MAEVNGREEASGRAAAGRSGAVDGPEAGGVFGRTRGVTGSEGVGFGATGPGATDLAATGWTVRGLASGGVAWGTVRAIGVGSGSCGASPVRCPAPAGPVVDGCVVSDRRTGTARCTGAGPLPWLAEEPEGPAGWCGATGAPVAGPGRDGSACGGVTNGAPSRGRRRAGSSDPEAGGALRRETGRLGAGAAVDGAGTADAPDEADGEGELAGAVRGVADGAEEADGVGAAGGTGAAGRAAGFEAARVAGADWAAGTVDGAAATEDEADGADADGALGADVDGAGATDDAEAAEGTAPVGGLSRVGPFCTGVPDGVAGAGAPEADGDCAARGVPSPCARCRPWRCAAPGGRRDRRKPVRRGPGTRRDPYGRKRRQDPQPQPGRPRVRTPTGWWTVPPGCRVRGTPCPHRIRPPDAAFP